MMMPKKYERTKFPLKGAQSQQAEAKQTKGLLSNVLASSYCTKMLKINKLQGRLTKLLMAPGATTSELASHPIRRGSGSKPKTC